MKAAKKLETSSMALEDVFAFDSSDVMEATVQNQAATPAEPAVYEVPTQQTEVATPQLPVNNTTKTEDKSKHKFIQFVSDNKVFLVCVGIAVVVWVGIKKGFINWN